MTYEKQIEKMARSACSIYDKNNTATPCGGEMLCDFNCTQYEICKFLYENGYRKASEVAREIFEEIERVAMSKIDTDLNITALNDTYYIEAIDEVKKKYESEDENGKRTYN